MFTNIFNKIKSFKKENNYENGAFSNDTDLNTFKVITKPCDNCRWWDNTKPLVCEAFPNGIPMPILLGYLDHTTPFGDEDLQYEAKVVTKKKSETGDFEELHPRYPKGSPKGGEFMPIGSPEYEAAKKESLDRFNPKKFALGRSVTNANPEDYIYKSTVRKIREGHQIAKKILNPRDFEEFQTALNSTEQDRLDGKESYKLHSTPNKDNPSKRDYTPERLKEHDRIIDELLKNPENKKPKEGEKPEFIIMGGPGGAGKSAFNKGSSKVFDESTHVKLDSDAIKEMLTGYHPEKAALFHTEAADILARALEESKKMGLNIALDATMSASEKPYIEEIKSRGYKVSVHYMHISPRESAGRAVSRWLNLKNGKPQLDSNGKPIRGRLVPTFRILGMVDNLDHFNEARKLADKWSFSRNDVPSGVAPIKVISSHPT